MRYLKVTEIDISKINPEDFANKLSFKRFMKGLKHVIEVQQLKDQGYMIFLDGEAMSPEAHFVYDDNNLRGSDRPVFGVGEENCMFMWLGCTFCDETGNVYVEKEEMEVFNKISYVSPKSIKKMRKLR